VLPLDASRLLREGAEQDESRACSDHRPDPGLTDLDRSIRSTFCGRPSAIPCEDLPAWLDDSSARQGSAGYSREDLLVQDLVVSLVRQGVGYQSDRTHAPPGNDRQDRLGMASRELRRTNRTRQLPVRLHRRRGIFVQASTSAQAAAWRSMVGSFHRNRSSPLSPLPLGHLRSWLLPRLGGRLRDRAAESGPHPLTTERLRVIPEHWPRRATSRLNSASPELSATSPAARSSSAAAACPGSDRRKPPVRWLRGLSARPSPDRAMVLRARWLALR